MRVVLKHGFPDGDYFDEDLILVAECFFKPDRQVGCLLSDKHHYQLFKVPHGNELVPDKFP